MALLASLPGRLLEPGGNVRPRGMIAHDRTRLIGGLPIFQALPALLSCHKLVLYDVFMEFDAPIKTLIYHQFPLHKCVTTGLFMTVMF